MSGGSVVLLKVHSKVIELQVNKALFTFTKVPTQFNFKKRHLELNALSQETGYRWLSFNMHKSWY